MSLPATVLRVLAVALLLLEAQPARAEARACSRLVIDAASSVGARWPELVPAARAALEQREGIDRCARVTLFSEKAAIDVEVALADGRVARRSVSAPEDVVPTLEALLLIPGREVRSSPAENEAVPAASAPPVVAARPPERPRPRDPRVSVNGRPRAAEADAAPGQRAKPDVRVELSAASGARLGDGQTSLGVGVLSFLELSGWLAGFEGRLDRYQPAPGVTRPVSSPPPAGGPPDGASGALELGVLVGRRVPLGSLALDFVLGPVAALQGTTTVETQAGVQSSSSTVPRLLVMSRLTWASRSVLRGFVGIDGEAGAARADGADIPGAPRLPHWTLGLTLGATVGTP